MWCQIEHAIVLWREEAKDSPYYPFVNATEALLFYSIISLRLSEEQVEGLFQMMRYGHAPKDYNECYICRYVEAHVCGGTVYATAALTNVSGTVVIVVYTFE